MGYTYTEDLTDEGDFVRFYTGDTGGADACFMSDEIITSLIAVEGSKEAAVIAGLDYIIRKLSEPDFKADWLQVSNAEARAGYERMRNRLQEKFGIDDYAISLSIKLPTRSDGNAGEWFSTDDMDSEYV